MVNGLTWWVWERVLMTDMIDVMGVLLAVRKGYEDGSRGREQMRLLTVTVTVNKRKKAVGSEERRVRSFANCKSELRI